MKQLDSNTLFFYNTAISIFLAAIILLITKPALAYHLFGGETPSNFFEGLMSGLSYPVIGLEHLAFVIAVGLLAAQETRGIFIPAVFVLATIAGTGIHLLSFNLPFPKLITSASVLAFGVVLASKNRPNSGLLVALAAAAAGIYHGYAYGEAIVGAEITPLIAYLAGFALIQLAIALIAFQIGRVTLKAVDQPSNALRFAGFTICGAGAVFLAESF